MSFCHSVYACKETFLCLTLVYGFGKKIQQEGVRKVFGLTPFQWLRRFSGFAVSMASPFLGFCGFAVSMADTV